MLHRVSEKQLQFKQVFKKKNIEVWTFLILRIPLPAKRKSSIATDAVLYNSKNLECSDCLIVYVLGVLQAFFQKCSDRSYIFIVFCAIFSSLIIFTVYWSKLKSSQSLLTQKSRYLLQLASTNQSQIWKCRKNFSGCNWTQGTLTLQLRASVNHN